MKIRDRIEVLRVDLKRARYFLTPGFLRPVIVGYRLYISKNYTIRIPRDDMNVRRYLALRLCGFRVEKL